MKKVVFVTGSRADYGIMRNYLSLLNNDESIKLSILATGALLNQTFGHQVDLIYRDGFQVDAEIDIPIDTTNNVTVIHTMSVAMDKFATYFSQNQIDLLIILGDRYEMLSVAVAAAMQRVPILHIHGGEATFGNYDEFIRHAITKMSLYHFTATEEYRKRVIQLGENPNKVYWLGALGAQNCLDIVEENVPSEIRVLPEKEYFVVLFHPETLANIDTLGQINHLLTAITYFPNYRFVFLGTNADTNSGIIRETVQRHVREHSNCDYYENLHTDAYHYLLKKSVCLIGNSSSGIIEAPSLGIYTINIGARQNGRVQGNSIINVDCTQQQIKDAILSVLNDGRTQLDIVNPYFKQDAAKNYYSATQQILNSLQDDTKTPKMFFDL